MMPTQSVEPGKKPLFALERIILCLIPRAKRQELIWDLQEQYERSPGDLRFAREAAKCLAVVVYGRALAACNAPVLIVQAGALYASFAGASWSFTVAFALLLGLVVLLLRDGHRYPDETPAEAFVDAVLAVSFVVVSVILIAVLSQKEILPAQVIVRGTFTSLVALALLRMVLRKPESETESGPREVAEQSYRRACWMNGIWAVAWILLILTNEDAPVPYVDLLFGFVPFAIVGMTFRNRQQGLWRPRKNEPASILGNHEKEELIRKRDLLWVPAGIAAEVLFFSVIVAEFFVTVVFSSAVDWVLVGTTFTASLMLFVVWMHIRKANRESAVLLQAEIDHLAAGKS